MKVPVGVSARHVHLSQEHVTELFGVGAELHPKKELSQPGQYAAEETVDLKGPRNTITGVRILGPVRPQTQVEISKTDAFKLGIDAPVRESGDIKNTPGITLIGPRGTVDLTAGVIVAKRHIHFSPFDARRFGVRDHDEIIVRTEGERGVIFDHVVARVNENFRLDFHIDTDEANAASLTNGQEVDVVEIEHFHGNEINRASSTSERAQTT